MTNRVVDIYKQHPLQRKMCKMSPSYSCNYFILFPLSVFAGRVWKGLHAALLLCSGHILPSRLWRLRLSSWIHRKRLWAEWVPQDRRLPPGQNEDAFINSVLRYALNDTLLMHEKARTSLTNLYVPPSACLPGTFGQNCNQVCQCSETNQLCHPVSGLCYCAPGFHGPKCDQST